MSCLSCPPDSSVRASPNDRCTGASEPLLCSCSTCPCRPIFAAMGEACGRRRWAIPDPPVVVLGGISANCFPCLAAGRQAGWWPGLVGDGCAIDPRDFCVLGVDFAADDTGASRADDRPSRRESWRPRSMRSASTRPCTIVGASYGGMVGLALAEARAASASRRLVIVSAGAEPHPAATAARELQRRVVALGIAIRRRRRSARHRPRHGHADLSHAEGVRASGSSGGIARCPTLACSAPGAYLRARGEAFRSVMSPERFLSLSASIDRHRVDPAQIAAPTPADRREHRSARLRRRRCARWPQRLGGPVELHMLDSLYGHDMFLKEAGADRRAGRSRSWQAARVTEPSEARDDRRGRAPADADPAYGSVAPPLWSSDTFRWDEPDDKPEYDYSRTVNPNRDMLVRGAGRAGGRGRRGRHQ